jgi:uncharacterized membrane protein
MGDFVVEGLPFLRLVPAADVGDEARSALLACFAVERQRTVQQDAPFGLQQIVDIAMKALSPGINDPTTALACIDHLGALLATRANRHLPSGRRASGGVVRVVARGPDFAPMLSLAFDAISEHAADHIEIYERLAATIGRLVDATSDAGRRAALVRQLEIVVACAERAGIPAHRRSAFMALCDGERRRLGRGDAAGSAAC